MYKVIGIGEYNVSNDQADTIKTIKLDVATGKIKMSTLPIKF